MKIRFKKKRLRSYLIMGSIWLTFGIASVLFFFDHFLNYGYVVLGSIYFGIYLFENHKQYMIIENGTISKNQLIPKKVNLNEIKRIKKFAGDYILKTDAAELRINTKFIDNNSLADLDAVLENLNLEMT